MRVRVMFQEAKAKWVLASCTHAGAGDVAHAAPICATYSLCPRGCGRCCTGVEQRRRGPVAPTRVRVMWEVLAWRPRGCG